MRLNDDEQAMRDGRDGEAVALAMDLLVRYGEALGAERLVDTHNVCGTVSATTPFMRDYAERKGGMDAIFSEFNLDADRVVEIPPVKVYSTPPAARLRPAPGRAHGHPGGDRSASTPRARPTPPAAASSSATPARRTRSATCPRAASTARGWNRRR